MKIILLGIVVAVISGGIIISMQNQEVETDNTLLIFGSFYPYYEFTKGVVGEIHTTKQFVPARADVHHWVIRHKDIIQLKNATAIVYNGLGIEPYINKLIDSKEFTNVTFIDASINIDTIHVESDHDSHDTMTKVESDHDSHDTMTKVESDHDSHDTMTKVESDHDSHDTMTKVESDHDSHDTMTKVESDHDSHDTMTKVESDHDSHDTMTKVDPHIWLDPIRVKKQIQNIGEELILIDPSNEKKYRQNMLEYNKQLDDLNENIKSKFVKCKYDSVVVSHNAYEYFAQRYDIDIISVHGFTDHIEITAQSMRQFIDIVREKGFKFIIDDDTRDSRMVQILGDEIGIDILYASTIESVSLEEEGVTYFDKMENVAHVFKTARGCE